MKATREQILTLNTLIGLMLCDTREMAELSRPSETGRVCDILARNEDTAHKARLILLDICEDK